MNDTPRTDAEAGYYDGSGCWKYDKAGDCVPSDFARELERDRYKLANEYAQLSTKLEHIMAIANRNLDAAEQMDRITGILSEL